MKPTTLVGAILACCFPLSAQGSMTTPPGGLSTEGLDSTYRFGWWANTRHQLADNTHTHRASVSITQIAFRLDNRNHNAWTAMGRTWASVTLDISETSNYANLSQTFSHNVTGVPTRVFKHKWSWPTVNGLPATKPDVWGGPSGQLRFPFTKPWAYTGKNAILMDYVFQGGTLANNYIWFASFGIPYHLDGQNVTLVKSGTSIPIPQVPNWCADSAFNGASPWARAYGNTYVHGPHSHAISLRHKVQLQHYSYFTAPNAPVVHAVGLGGLAGGVHIGARCHPLYVDVTRSAVLVRGTTQGTNAFSGLMTAATPWDNALAELKLYIQAAWTDSRTSALSLTSASRLTLPDGMPPKEPSYKFKVSSKPGSSIADPPWPNLPDLFFPYTRYSIQ